MAEALAIRFESRSIEDDSMDHVAPFLKTSTLHLQSLYIRRQTSLDRRGQKSRVLEGDMRSIDHDRKLLSLEILPYLWKEALLEKSLSQNTRVYRLHFMDFEISAFSPLLRPGLLQTYTVTSYSVTNKQTTITLIAHARRGLIIIIMYTKKCDYTP